MSKQQDSALEVWLTMTSALHVWSARWLMTVARSASLRTDWLKDPRAFALDPGLPGRAPFFPKPELGNFGIFLTHRLTAGAKR